MIQERLLTHISLGHDIPAVNKQTISKQEPKR